MSVVSGFHDRSSPYLINSASRLVSRLMPIIAKCPEYAVPLLFHLCSRLFIHDTSRVDGAEVFFELCRIRSCALQLIQADSSLTQTASILFAPRNLPGGENMCLIEHLRKFPVTQMRVIDAFINLQGCMPQTQRLPIAQSTIQHLIGPLRSVAAPPKSKWFRLKFVTAERKCNYEKTIGQDLRSLSRGVLSIPPTAEGMKMVQDLIVSVLHPLARDGFQHCRSSRNIRNIQAYL